jgi:hypothetical protein
MGYIQAGHGDLLLTWFNRSPKSAKIKFPQSSSWRNIVKNILGETYHTKRHKFYCILKNISFLMQFQNFIHIPDIFQI